MYVVKNTNEMKYVNVIITPFLYEKSKKNKVVLEDIYIYIYMCMSVYIYVDM